MSKYLGIILMITISYVGVGRPPAPMTIRELSVVILGVGVGICWTIIENRE